MSQITQLATGEITAVDVVTIELVETGEHPTVIIKWPSKATVLHPRRFPGAADSHCVRQWRVSALDDGRRLHTRLKNRAFP
jgi:hypothetical protein